MALQPKTNTAEVASGGQIVPREYFTANNLAAVLAIPN
jgi:hypothetical protein